MLSESARPADDAVIDYVNGCADLRAKVIRCIGDPNARFGEDALRMLRAVRFAAQLGFDIDPGTEEAIRFKAGTLTNVSRERVAAELFRIVSAPYPVKGLAPLASTGLLRVKTLARSAPGAARRRATPPVATRAVS